MFTNPQRMASEESKRLRKQAGSWLHSVRLRHGLGQREVAEATNFRYYTNLAQIETGIGRVSPDRLHLFAAVLGLDPQYMARRLMRSYDPVTFSYLFSEDEVLGQEPSIQTALQEPLRVPEYRPEDVKRLRQEVGAIIRRRREQLGLSQPNLSDILGYRFYTRVSQIERGIGRVPPEEFPDYARALEWDLKDFAKTMLAHYDPMVHHLVYLDEMASRTVGK